MGRLSHNAAFTGAVLGGLEKSLLCWREPSLHQEPRGRMRLAVRLRHQNSSYDNPKSQTCLSPLIKIHNNCEIGEENSISKMQNKSETA